MKRTDERGGRAPKQASGDPAPAEAVKGRAATRATGEPSRAAPAPTPSAAAASRAPSKAAGAPASTKPASEPAPKTSGPARAPKTPSVKAAKKPVDDRSLERALDDRAAMEALANRSLESLVDQYAPPRGRSLDKIDAIVAPRTTDPTVNLVPGARVRQCALCNTDIWVAPSSFAAFKGRTMPPLWCAECAMMYAELNSPNRRRPAGRA